MSTKVLMFGWEFPPHNSGGLGVACYGLARALARENIDLTFVLPKKINVQADFLKLLFANVRSIRLRQVDTLLYPYVTSSAYSRIREGLSSHEDTIYGISLLEEVKRYGMLARGIALQGDYDVIHAHDWLSFLAGIEAKRVTNKPLVVHVHATEFDRTGGGRVNQEVYEIEKRGMEEADCVIAVSGWTKNLIVQHYGIPEEKIEVVHNGVNEEEFSAPLPNALDSFRRQGYGVVLFVGRITLQKGPDYFIRLAKRVLEYRPKTLFVVSGSGDMEAQMVREAAEAGIGDKVLFAGFLRGDELRAIYRSADLYVLPSVSEPFGITPLEALVSGTPVLVSKQSGVSEVLTDVFKADFWDIDDMADKTISLLDHPQLKDVLRENGKRNVAKITWGEAARKCVSVYDKLCAYLSPSMTRDPSRKT